MRGKAVKLSLFILSSVCLVISLKLFWNMGIYVDEHGTSPDVVLGGDLWLYMDWLRLICSGLLCILSGINLLGKNK